MQQYLQVPFTFYWASKHVIFSMRWQDFCEESSLNLALRSEHVNSKEPRLVTFIINLDQLLSFTIACHRHKILSVCIVTTLSTITLLSTHYLHTIYNLHTIYILSTQYLQTIYPLSTYYLHTNNTLTIYTSSIHYYTIYILFTYHLHGIYSLSTHYLRTIYPLSTDLAHEPALVDHICPEEQRVGLRVARLDLLQRAQAGHLGIYLVYI